MRYLDKDSDPVSLSFDLSLERCFDSDLELDFGFWLGKLRVRNWSEKYINVVLGCLPGV